MPFWKKKGSCDSGSDPSEANGDHKPKEKVNYKARLEHKQYLAQESPEPVYDISDCGLKAVPPGVYSKCKVLRKEALLMQNNELLSLTGGACGLISDMSVVLQVLDLRCNQLEKLPDEIGALKELRVLYVQRNRLKRLPDSLGELRKLQSLDVSHNCIKELPLTLSKLTRLRTLDLAGNPKLTKLDRTLANVKSLDKLNLDAKNFQYPDSAVCQEGTEAIMRFLAKECDIEYIPPSEYQPPPDGGCDDNNEANGKKKLRNGFEDDPYDRIVRGSLKIIEQQKETKLREMVAMQKDQEEHQAKEAQLAANVQSNKKRLLTDLAKDEARRDEAVKKVQKLKEKEKGALVESLFNAENRTDVLISELMKSNARHSDPKRVLEEMEKERKDMEEMFSIKAGEECRLREKEVLREMERLMEEELRREQIRRQYEAGRKDIINTALTSDLENDKAVDAVLQSKGKQQKELISNLLADEKYQREAFTALFVKQDAKHKEISQQVQNIQSELANLTMIEMTKKDLKLEFERDAMAEKRETLSKMLVQLIGQKTERAQELQERLKELEEGKAAQTENYWLIQYQKLLDSKPKTVAETEKSVEPALRKVLEAAGAEDYIPVFALKGITLKQLQYMKDKELSEELGIHNAYMRQKLLLCANGGVNASVTASAPPLSEEPSAPAETKMNNSPEKALGATPSAPPLETFQSNECVVCMEKKCDIIFLPCGHVCCCWTCETQMTACPLCRAEISQKVRLH